MGINSTTFVPSYSPIFPAGIEFSIHISIQNSEGYVTEFDARAFGHDNIIKAVDTLKEVIASLESTVTD